MTFVSSEIEQIHHLGHRVDRVFDENGLAWERSGDQLWASSINFGQDGDGANLPDWNNIKPADLSGGGTFNNLVDGDSTPRLSMSASPVLVTEIAPLPMRFQFLPNYPNLYARGWAVPGGNSATLTFSGLPDNAYSVIIFGAAPGAVGLSSVPWTVNGITLSRLQGYDTDGNIDYNSTFARFDNITPTEGTISVMVTIPSGGFGALFGAKVIAYDKTIVRNSNYEIEPVPDTDPLAPPCAYYHCFKPGTKAKAMPLIISLPMGQTEGNGTAGQMNNVIGGNIMKAIITGGFNPPEDVRVIAPQFYANVDNAHLLDALITHLKSAYNIDDDRVYIMGVSAGGENALYYAGYLGQGEPLHPIKAMMVANTPLDTTDVSYADIAASQIPIWFFSATGDNPPWIDTIISGIQAADPDYPLKYTEFIGGNHWTPIHFVYGKRKDVLPRQPGHDVYRNGEIYGWLLSH